jgi:hypothetical protein
LSVGGQWCCTVHLQAPVAGIRRPSRCMSSRCTVVAHRPLVIDMFKTRITENRVVSELVGRSPARGCAQY